MSDFTNNSTNSSSKTKSNANEAKQKNKNALKANDDEIASFKEALFGGNNNNKRNLEEFLKERVARKPDDDDDDLASYFGNNNSNNGGTNSGPQNWIPFLNSEDGSDNAITTEGLLALLQILELSRTRTCCSFTTSSFLPLLHIHQLDNYSCGYRNLQMLLSALIGFLPDDHPYYQQIPPSLHRSDIGTMVPVPSFGNLQLFLEQAWARGLDPRGREHYRGTIVGKSEHIGAVEVTSILAQLQIDSVVVQFIKTEASRQMLGKFVWEYFGPHSQDATAAAAAAGGGGLGAAPSSFSSSCGLCRGKGGVTRNGGHPNNHEIIQSAHLAEDLLEAAAFTAKQPAASSSTSQSCCNCPRLPLYLQWEGHSVTIVGIQQQEEPQQYSSNNYNNNNNNNNSTASSFNLLIFDPEKDGSYLKELLNQALLLTSSDDPKRRRAAPTSTSTSSTTTPTTRSSCLQPLLLPCSKLESKDCQIVVATARGLDAADLLGLQERVNAVTAARASVVQSLGGEGTRMRTR